MPNPAVRTVVAIGGSAGGLDALQEIVSTFPGDLDAAVLVAIHQWPAAESILPQLLSRAGPLPALHPREETPIEPGRIYVAPPDRHLVAQNGSVRAYLGPQENRHRPSIDVLFRSASLVYRDRVIGVLLSGADDDGAAGLHVIQRAGGAAIVQDPAGALFPEMPLSALRKFTPDYKLPVDRIGPAIARLAAERRSEKKGRMTESPSPTPGPREQITEASEERFGQPSAFTCPDCGGALWELEEGELTRFSCRVGHAFSPTSMLAAESDRVEKALWQSVRALKESAAVCRRIAHRTGELSGQFNKRAEERERNAQIIREFIETGSFKS